MDILTVSPEYSDRMIRWLVGAYKLGAYHGGFAESLRGLGRLDCALKSADRFFYNYMNGGGEIGKPVDNIFFDFPLLSNLWMMGMYEVLRTLSQILRNDEKLGKAHPATDEVSLLKIRFERVRIPLAKFERASRFPTDYEYISQFQGGPDGWGWVVDAKTVIYRNDLADEVLNLFDKFDDTQMSLLFKK